METYQLSLVLAFVLAVVELLTLIYFPQLCLVTDCHFHSSVFYSPSFSENSLKAAKTKKVCLIKTMM